jgi:hypothetical protein
MLERLAAAVHVHDLNGLAVLDILILAAIIYQILLLIRGSRAVHMIVGVVALLLLHLLTRPGLLYLPAVHAVLGDLLLYIPLAVIVLFQNQLRQVLARVGRNPMAALISRKPHDNIVEEIALAAVSLASKRLGALSSSARAGAPSRAGTRSTPMSRTISSFLFSSAGPAARRRRRHRWPHSRRVRLPPADAEPESLPNLRHAPSRCDRDHRGIGRDRDRRFGTAGLRVVLRGGANRRRSGCAGAHPPPRDRPDAASRVVVALLAAR